LQNFTKHALCDGSSPDPIRVYIAPSPLGFARSKPISLAVSLTNVHAFASVHVYMLLHAVNAFHHGIKSPN